MLLTVITLPTIILCTIFCPSYSSCPDSIPVNSLQTFLLTYRIVSVRIITCFFYQFTYLGDNHYVFISNSEEQSRPWDAGSCVANIIAPLLWNTVVLLPYSLNPTTGLSLARWTPSTPSHTIFVRFVLKVAFYFGVSRLKICMPEGRGLDSR